MGLAKGEVTGKDKLLAAYATEGRPMLVFAQLQPEQERCVKVLEEQGLRVGLINANVSLKQRNKRSEEHTSELQSLMRISYAVFCLKKKNKDKQTNKKQLKQPTHLLEILRNINITQNTIVHHNR